MVDNNYKIMTMKKIYITKSVLLLLAGIFISSIAFSKDYPKLIPDFKKVKLETGETFSLPDSMLYAESDEVEKIKVEIGWTLEPDSLGAIVDLTFTAEKPGEGYLYATYDTISVDIELEIEAREEEDDNDDDEFPKFLLGFDEVELDTGQIYQLPVLVKYWEHQDSAITEVEVMWTLIPDSIASIDEYGVITAKKAGKGYLYINYQSLRDSIEFEIEVEDEEKDDLDDDAPKIKIVPGHVRVELGDSLELYAFYVDTLKGKMDTTFMWSVEPPELGVFTDPQVPVFKPDTLGKGVIIATLGDLADTIKIAVYEGRWGKRKGKDDNSKGHKKLTILPGDTTVMAEVGMLQYYATYESQGEKNPDTELIWSVSDTSIATIDNSGLLLLKGYPGLLLVSVEYKNFKKSVELLVLDPSVDMDVNTITIQRVLPNGQKLKPKIFKEGESYKIGGLPYPLNILNAGMLHFPFGCISEDITIYMKIPEDYASIDDSTDVTFSDEIITGVQFDVQPEGADTIVHPYGFDIPLELKLIFKRELLDSLGIEPQDIDVFFAENAEFIQVGEGMAMVDSAANRIYASIVHFSTIVVREAELATAIKEKLAQSNDVLDIYPNPLNTAATIQFNLAEPGDVQIEVYSLFGQKIQVLTNQKYNKGLHKIMWAGDNMDGSPVSSGIYLCQFIKDGKVAQIKKVVVKH